MMIEKLKIGMKLKKKFHYQTNKNVFIYKGIILSIFLMFLFLIIEGCQKKERVIIYMGEPSYDDTSLDELLVKDGDYQAALERCEERLRKVKETESVEAADIFSIMGGIYAGYAGDKQQALFYINRAMDIHKKRNDEIGLAGDYNQMAKIYIDIEGDPNEGMEYLKKAESIYIKYEMYETKLMAGTLINKGLLEKKQGQYEKALEYYKEAQEIYERKQIQYPVILVYKGTAYAKMYEYELAEDQYLEAKRLWVAENNTYYEARINTALGSLYSDMEDYDKSLEFYKQALEIYELGKEEVPEKAIVYSNMGYSYYHKRDLGKALEYSINACRTMEYIDSELKTNNNIYKKNLKLYYEEWSNDKQKEEFEMWYKRVILEGEDWQ